MTVYLLPATQQTCVSYFHSPDLLHIHSHLKDRSTKISVRGSRLFDVGPMIFRQGLDILNPKKRFQITNVEFTRIWLQGTKIIGDEIYVTPNRRAISNIYDIDYRVCWGGNFNGIKTMRSMIDNFFRSPFNGDLCNLDDSIENCISTRNDVARQQFNKSNFSLISKDAHALYILYNTDNIANFFKMSAAGFLPLPENRNIMIIPLKETILTYGGVDYHGFLTPLDSCNKKWFILPNGTIVGQYNYRTMAIREPEFAPIPSSPENPYQSYDDDDDENEDEEEDEDENM